MLDIKLDRGQPEYLQIAEQVQWAVASGRLQRGERLQPVRDLAARLGINPSTVARAYRLLEQSGVIETAGRRGSVIAGSGSLAEGAALPVLSEGGVAALQGETGRPRPQPEQALAAMQALRQARLRNLAERAVVEALAQGYAVGEVEAALSLQLAAWRERRASVLRSEVTFTDTGVQSHAGENTFARLSRFTGSHDPALEALWAQVQHLHPEAPFVPSYVGSLDGLLALLHGETGVAGTHILDEETGEYNLPILRRLFVAGGLCVVTLAERVQGVMVAPGNPLRITSMADLARPGVRFVNRQPGSGTRALLDYNLRRLDLEPACIAGYDRIVTTHMAVAAAVTDGTADAGLGVLAAARAFGLDFVPVAKERYDLVLWAKDRTSPPLSRLLGALRGEEFRAVVGAMGGYDTAHTGEEFLL